MEEENEFAANQEIPRVPSFDEVKTAVGTVVDKVGGAADIVVDKVGDVASTLVDKVGEHIDTIKYITPQVSVYTTNIIFKAIIAVWLIISTIFYFQVSGWFIFSVVALFDFWYTKKVALRKLLGINYTCNTDPSGDLTWKYEKLKDQEPSKGQRICFWALFAGNVALQAILIIVNLFRLNFGWIFILSVSIAINAFIFHMIMKCDEELNTLFKQRTSGVNTHVITFFSSKVEEIGGPKKEVEEA